MRDLTQQEIDNAPSWATHYVLNCDGVMFESLSKTQMMIKGQLTDLIPFGGVSIGAKPMPRKSFDISEYEFKYFDSACVSVDSENEIEIQIHEAQECTKYITKSDAIALAKHFKLTADELK